MSESYRRRITTLVLLLGTAVLVSCGSEGPTEAELVKHIANTYESVGVSHESVRIDDRTFGEGYVDLSLTTTGVMTESWYVAFDLEKSMSEAGFDTKARKSLTEAIKSTDKLPEPKRSELQESAPDPIVGGNWYRRVGESGDTVRWTAKTRAEDDNDTWKFGRINSAKPVDLDEKAIPESLLPRSARRIDAKNDEGDATKMMIDARQKWLVSLKDAEAEVNEFFDETKKDLLSALEVGMSWSGWLEIPNSPAEEISLDVFGNEEDGKILYVGISRPDKPMFFFLLEGGIQKHIGGKFARGSEVPWGSIASFKLASSANHAIEEMGRSVFKNQLLALYVDPSEAQTLHATIKGQDATLSRNGSNFMKGKTIQDAKERVIASLQPGMLWRGTVRPRNGSTVNVDITCAAYENDGGSIRLVAGLTDDPYRVNMFTGRVGLDGPDPFGWTIRVEDTKQLHSSDSCALTSYYGKKLVLRLDNKGKLVGYAGNEQVVLEPSGRSETPLNVPSRVRAAAKQGSLWRGTATGKNASVENIEIEFTSYENDGGALIATVHQVDNPAYVAVFDGYLAIENDNAKQWPIRFKRGKITPALDEIQLLNHYSREFHLRLLEDGRLVGWSLSGNDEFERLELTQVSELRRTIPVDRSELKAELIELCGEGAIWRGTSKYREDTALDLEIRFEELNASTGDVAFEVKTLKSKERTSAKFTGRMKFDKLHIDGWQMTGLKREPNRLSPGIGTGFLQHYVPGDIYLRITPEVRSLDLRVFTSKAKSRQHLMRSSYSTTTAENSISAYLRMDDS